MLDLLEFAVGDRIFWLYDACLWKCLWI